MSDMLTAGGGPLTKTIAGREVKLAELSFKDRRELLREHRAEERRKRKDLLTESGLPPEQQYAELRDFDCQTVGFYVWVMFFDSDEGKHRILARSIEKMQQGQGETLAGEIDWDSDEITRVAAAVCHEKIQKRAPSKDGASEDDQGNAQGAPPAAYGR